MSTRSPNWKAVALIPVSGSRDCGPTLFEVLVGFGKLAGGERFTSARFHYDSHSASSFFDEPTGSPYRLIGSANGYSLRKVAVGRPGRHARTSWNTPSVCFGQ